MATNVLKEEIRKQVKSAVLKEMENNKPYPSYSFKKNRQGYEEDGSKGPWFSRSVAMATIVFLQNTQDSRWYVLANRRGEGAADNHGKWNCPCGYLDYNESPQEGAAREVREETGVQLSPNQLKLVRSNGNPQDDALQNVVFLFCAILRDDITKFGLGTTDGGEENEVSNIKWIPLDEVDQYVWAFNHDKYIPEFAQMFKIDMDDNETEYDSYNCVAKASQLIDSGDIEGAKAMLNRAMQIMRG